MWPVVAKEVLRAKKDMGVRMLPARKADVIVAVDDNAPECIACLESVLRFSGPVLNRLILVARASLGANVDRAVENLRQATHGSPSFAAADSLSDVDACNRGLSQRQGDAVILAANARVTEGWLSELAAVAHSEERIACGMADLDIGAIGSALDRIPGSAASRTKKPNSRPRFPAFLAARRRPGRTLSASIVAMR